MSGVRLPLIGERTPGAPPRGLRTTTAERLVPAHTVVTVAGAETDTALTPALLRFAQDLVRALAAEGRPALVLAVPGEARADHIESLRDAGAERVIEVEGAEEGLARRALAALEPLARDALAIAVGAALARALQPVLSIRIAPAHAFDGRPDLELPRDSAAVSSAIAERLARTSAAEKGPTR